MAYLTVILLVIALSMTPLKIKIGGEINLTDKTAVIVARLFGIKIFDEKLSLDGKNLNCRGTISGSICLPKVSLPQSNRLIKSATLEYVGVEISVRLAEVSSVFALAAINILREIATAIAKTESCCKIYTASQFDDKSAVAFETKLSFTAAEVIFALLNNKE